jgi:aminoglycoside phosphotransferase (APT) family kinase protein
MAEQTNPVDVETAAPPKQLGAWIADHVAGASGPVRVDQLAGGSSNLTFRVRDDANDWVLRRPPLSHVLATAHDMTREFRVQSALQQADVPVARQFALCDDDTVIGAPFYLMARLDGVVYDDVDAVDGITEAQGLAASYELVDVLARLHCTDYDAIGLGEFGRPAGFMARQIQRWQKQWANSVLVDVPAVDEVARRLEATLPPDGRHAIVHGDYSFNNTMFDAADPTRMIAVLDWEMSTLGDPLADVGMLAVYWGDVGELMWRSRRPQAHRANAGFPDVDTLLDRYARTSGADLGHIDFYRAFATYKLAVISQGAAKRISLTDPDRAAGTVGTVEALAELALGFTHSL